MSIENCIAERQLEDGTSLRLTTWVSEVVRPGQRMYQLKLVEGGLTIRFPTAYEKFTEARVREMYASIQSRKELLRIMKEQDEQRQSSERRPAFP